MVTKEKIHRSCKRVTEFSHLLANEPSVGLYHVQIHLGKAVPKIAEVQGHIERAQKTGQDLLSAVDDSRETAKTLDSLATFDSIERHVLQSITLLEDLLRVKS